MSIKSTSRITRETAIHILMREIPNLPNDALASLMDTLADTEQSKHVSRFDNFIVSNIVDVYEEKN